MGLEELNHHFSRNRFYMTKPCRLSRHWVVHQIPEPIVINVGCVFVPNQKVPILRCWVSKKCLQKCIHPSRQLIVHWQSTMVKFHSNSDFHLPQSQNCLVGWVLFWKIGSSRVNLINFCKFFIYLRILIVIRFTQRSGLPNLTLCSKTPEPHKSKHCRQ